MSYDLEKALPTLAKKKQDAELRKQVDEYDTLFLWSVPQCPGCGTSGTTYFRALLSTLYCIARKDIRASRFALIINRLECGSLSLF